MHPRWFASGLALVALVGCTSQSYRGPLDERLVQEAKLERLTPSYLIVHLHLANVTDHLMEIDGCSLEGRDERGRYAFTLADRRFDDLHLWLPTGQDTILEYRLGFDRPVLDGLTHAQVRGALGLRARCQAFGWIGDPPSEQGGGGD